MLQIKVTEALDAWVKAQATEAGETNSTWVRGLLEVARLRSKVALPQVSPAGVVSLCQGAIRLRPSDSPEELELELDGHSIPLDAAELRRLAAVLERAADSLAPPES